MAHCDNILAECSLFTVQLKDKCLFLSFHCSNTNHVRNVWNLDKPKTASVSIISYIYVLCRMNMFVSWVNIAIHFRLDYFGALSWSLIKLIIICIIPASAMIYYFVQNKYIERFQETNKLIPVECSTKIA